MVWCFKKLRGSLAFAFMISSASPLTAGVLVGAGPHWQSYTFKPLAEEPTPNYRGYGASGIFGYSINQSFDCDLFAAYTPSRPDAASFAKETARFTSYGAGFALRMDETIYIGIHGGRYNYKVIHLTKGVTGEIDNEWEGPGGTISIGAFLVKRKETMSQITFDLGSATVKPKHPLADGTSPLRHIDAFSISIKYIFNRYESSRFSSLFSSGFLSSL